MRDAYSGTYKVDSIGTMCGSGRRDRSKKSSFDKVLENTRSNFPKLTVGVSKYKIKFEEFFSIVYDNITTTDTELIVAKYGHRPTTVLVLNSRNWRHICKEEYGELPYLFIVKNKSLMRNLSRAVYEITFFKCDTKETADRYNLKDYTLNLVLNKEKHTICSAIAEGFINFRKENC